MYSSTYRYEIVMKSAATERSISRRQMTAAALAHQIEVVAILEAVVKPDDPVCAPWRADERGGLKQVAFRANVSFLALTQHIDLAQLYGVHGQRCLGVNMRKENDGRDHLLHGEELPRGTFPDQGDHAEST